MKTECPWTMMADFLRAVAVPGKLRRSGGKPMTPTCSEPLQRGSCFSTCTWQGHSQDRRHSQRPQSKPTHTRLWGRGRMGSCFSTCTWQGHSQDRRHCQRPQSKPTHTRLWGRGRVDTTTPWYIYIFVQREGGREGPTSSRRLRGRGRQDTTTPWYIYI